jgi:hypothetical protein
MPLSLTRFGRKFVAERRKPPGALRHFTGRLAPFRFKGSGIGREPPAAAKPDGLRPAATCGFGNLFADDD